MMWVSLIHPVKFFLSLSHSIPGQVFPFFFFFDCKHVKREEEAAEDEQAKEEARARARASKTRARASKQAKEERARASKQKKSASKRRARASRQAEEERALLLLLALRERWRGLGFRV